MEYLQQIKKDYIRARKKVKGEMLQEAMKICQLSRKHIIKVLNKPFLTYQEKKERKQRKRDYKYSKELFRLIAIVWRSFNYPCGPKLKAMFSTCAHWIKKELNLSDAQMALISQIGCATLDRRLKLLDRANKKKLSCSTVPVTWLKNQIEIKRNYDLVKQPGHIQVDLVSHCGDNNSGDFAYTCNFTDVFSGWTDSRAFIGKSQLNTLNAISDIINNVPFNIISIHSDNGSEFINHHLFAFCKQNKISFSRSKPYHKNDNCFIEQKNFTHVRKILGYLRFDTPILVNLINKLYGDLVTFNNVFCPSTKLLSKIRKNSKIFKTYDSYKTPLQRLLDSNSKSINSNILNSFHSSLFSLNPFVLQNNINNQIRKIFSLALKLKSNKSFLNAA